MKFLTWLNGKKTMIGGVSSLTIGFLQAKQIIDGETAFFCLSIAGVLLGVGVTHKINKGL